MSDLPPDPPPLMNADLRQELQAEARQQIADLLASIADLTDLANNTTNAQINQNPAVAIKTVGREVVVIGRMVARLARLVIGAFDADDIG